MIEINSFAFCFLSQHIEDIQRQELELTKLSDRFLIERWYRKDRNESNYLSFSQMIIECILLPHSHNIYHHRREMISI